MTKKKFWDIINQARRTSAISEETVELPFSCGTEAVNHLHEFDDYQVMFQNNNFLWIKDKKTGEYIEESDTTDFEVSNMSDDELTKLIADAQKIIKIRRKKEAQKIIDNLMTEWKKLQSFDGVYATITMGEKMPQSIYVKDIKLEVKL